MAKDMLGMDVKSIGAGLTLRNHFPLKMASGSALAGGLGNFHQGVINGQNLVRKSAQLVNDIERLRDMPKTLDTAGIVKQAGLKTVPNETSFQKLVDDIKARLSKDEQPYTLLNVVKAQQTLAKEAQSKPEVDQKA